jgi:uncharacterized protein
MSEKELIEKDLQEKAQEQRQQELRNLERYHFLKENGYILFETITGSQAHGTNTETSDIDKAFVYILPEEDILGVRYKEQLKIHKDFMGYEIRRFLELLRHANPTILELLNSPEDCILIKHPAFDWLINEKDKFITKACENSFFGYARQQRTKAEGLEKLQNWEVNRVTKKSPIDFCSVVRGYDTMPLTYWLEKQGLDQKFCGLAAVNHCRDLYAVFYDHEAHKAFSELVPEAERETYRAMKVAEGATMGFGYKGVAFEDSNDIRLSNIPFEEREQGFICNMSYNKDGYMKHCKDYKRYQDWLENRNENRWVEIKGHGQQIDGKNMMHFMRLVIIGREIAQGKGIRIRRPDAQELLKIRRGEVSLRELFDKSDEILSEMKKLFQDSNLPTEVSEDFVHELLVKIRKDFYSKQAAYGVFVENKEATNTFIQKRFGNLSPLQFLMKEKIDEAVREVYNGDFSEFVESYDNAWLNVIPRDMWPESRISDTDEYESADTENVRILGANREKVTVIMGGDWQVGVQFDIVMWADGAAIINVREPEDTDADVRYEEFLKLLGYTIPEDEDSE